MSSSSTTGADLARLSARVQELVSQGRDIAQAYAEARAAAPTKALAKIDRQQNQVAAKHEKALQRHASRVAARHRNAVTLTAVSGASAVLGVIDAASSALPGAPWMWLCGAAVTAVLAVRTRYQAQHATAPTTPPPAVATLNGASSLRRDATGWPEAQGLLAVRRQVVAMVPAVTSLHPDAGRALARADAEAGPVLSAQVSRLVLLDQVVRDLPGTQAALAGRTAAVQVQQRLGDGVRRYDELLAAAARMLAAPDLGRDLADVLGPAADELTAYAHGLTVQRGTTTRD